MSNRIILLPSVIDNNQYRVRYHVLPEHAIPGAECIIGREFLDSVNFNNNKGTINIKPKLEFDEGEDTRREISRMLRIEIRGPEEQKEELIVSKQYEELIKNLKDNYTPARSSPTAMTINLIDKTPISQRPRWLKNAY